jgi:two-component system nitrate/nitrite response regulator NarL
VADVDIARLRTDAVPPESRRILIRMFDRLGGDALKAFIESRAADLALDLCESDEALRDRVAAAAPQLVVWCPQASEPDPFAGLLSVFGTTRLTPIVLMVERYDATLVARALAHGIAGLVTRQMSADMVLCVLRLILAGGTYFPCDPAWFAPAIAPSAEASAALAPAAGLRRGAYGLTPRQLDVLGYICQGMSNKIIARALGMRETTVKAHVMQIMRRLNADNRTQVALRVAQAGFAPPPAAPIGSTKS